MRRRTGPWFIAAGLGLGLLWAGTELALATRIADIRNTKHNLSVSGTGSVTAVSESQICVFCHTPHGAEPIQAPLWNRKLAGSTYTPYLSSSMVANPAELAAAPDGYSKLCLSCHDGTMALGTVDVLNGQSPASIAMNGTGVGGTMPTGAGALTGYTRDLGVNLTNDHPISFTYDSTLASKDGELWAPDGTTVGTRVPGSLTKPLLPLEAGKLECTTCHDPHIRDTDPTLGDIKFLRANRLQAAAPTGGAFNPNSDTICLACHDKAGPTWAYSAHANPLVANETYTASAAAQREFPSGTQVWQAACLNCHDPHTVQGARRLLREGTDSTAVPKSGGNSAIEQTCYQCHTNSAQSIVTPTTNVADIQDDFSLPRHMPITSTDQPAGMEVHDIGTYNADAPTNEGSDFIESRSLLGFGNLTNRHAECTDCHNPHRIIRNQVFYGNLASPDATSTHILGSNIASGALRGTWGVEPNYSAHSFGSLPASYTLKRGDPGGSVDSTVTASYVTREYQICLKCHSDYGFGTTPPMLGSSGGGTPSGTNGLLQFTNQAMEFQSPVSHQGEVTTTDSGAFAGVPPGQGYTVNFQTNNHRSWHPVMLNTGRTPAVRGNASANLWLSPWNANVGNETMYCSDCHGSNTASGTVVPGTGQPWGPHGSTNNFILKGPWSGDKTTGTGEGTPGDLCFKCHDYNQYGNPNPPTVLKSGFSGSGGGGGAGTTNWHVYHAAVVTNFRCSLCHVAVPHGWKNKAFLVNLNDVGPEGGLAAGTQVRNNTTAGYTNPPYYNRAVLKVKTFAKSGNWSAGNCGSVGAPGNGQTGIFWMWSGTEACNNVP